MSGLGSRHGNLYRLEITHFAKENDIRALAQRRTQRRYIADGIDRNLALADDTLIVAVKKFQWIFQCDNVFMACLVDVVDHAGKCCRFTASGRTGDEYQTFGKVGKINDLLRNSLLLCIRQRERDHSDDGG